MLAEHVRSGRFPALALTVGMLVVCEAGFAPLAAAASSIPSPAAAVAAASSSPLTSTTPSTRPDASAAGVSLTGTAWRLIELGGQPLSDEQRAGQAMLTLNPADEEGGQAVGNTGCNRFFGRYTAHGERLFFSRLGSTKMACEGVRGQLEQQFLDGLSRSARRQIRNGRLVLLDSRGEVLAAFEAGKPRR